MKSITKYIALPCLIAMSLGGCNKFEDFGTLNVNPNASDVPATGALMVSGLQSIGSYSTETRGGIYTQQFSETQYTEVSLYQAPVLDFTGIYAAALMDLDRIIQIASDPTTVASASTYGAPENQIAIARIAKAFYFWVVTDKWGDVPYTQALKPTEYMMPAYDSPETIYKGIMQELTEAVDQINLSVNNVKGDIIASGNNQSATWARFANSLRMMIALRTSNVYPGASEWGAVEFKKAFEHPRGYISTNAQNVASNYDAGVVAYGNPWWSLFRTRADYAVSDVIGEAMESFNDPRTTILGTSTVWFPYGLPRQDAVNFGSANTDYAWIFPASLRTQNSKAPILTASQVALAIAEAAELNWISADADTWLENGVTLSWEQYNVGSGVDVADYLADVTTETGYSGLQLIQYQQWLSWYGNGFQSWANWRRTRIPALTPTPNAQIPGTPIPERYQYPTTELANNEASARPAFDKYANNSADSKLWFAK